MASSADEEPAGRDAILLKPAPLPVLGHSDSRSFFGGLPLMPRGLPWPRKDVGSRSRPLTFAAQIALDEIPRGPSSELPESGTLCFFLDLTKEWLELDDAAVVYFEQPPASCIEHRSPWRFSDEGPGSWFWLNRDELPSYPHHKFPIEFLRFRSYADYAAGRSGSRYRSPVSGQPWKVDEIPRWTFEVERDDWPFAWGVVEHTARAVLKCIELAEEAGDEISDKVADVGAAAQTWLEQSRSHGTFDPPDAAARSDFRSRCNEWRPIVAPLVPREARMRAQGLDALLTESVRLVVSLCKDQRRDLVCVPPRLRTLAERAWEPLVYREVERCGAGASLGMNQMLGFGEAVQTTPLDRADEVLLLQINADQYVNWWPDAALDGVIQLWIAPPHLAERRFDRVVASFDCS